MFFKPSKGILKRASNLGSVGSTQFGTLTGAELT